MENIGPSPKFNKTQADNGSIYLCKERKTNGTKAHWAETTRHAICIGSLGRLQNPTRLCRYKHNN